MLTTITLKKGDISGVKLPELGGARPNGCYKLTNFDAVTIDAKLHFQVENAEEAAQLSKAMGGSMLAKFKPRVEVDYDELASSGKAKVTALPQPEPNAEAKKKGKKKEVNKHDSEASTQSDMDWSAGLAFTAPDELQEKDKNSKVTKKKVLKPKGKQETKAVAKPAAKKRGSPTDGLGWQLRAKRDRRIAQVNGALLDAQQAEDVFFLGGWHQRVGCKYCGECIGGRHFHFGW